MFLMNDGTWLPGDIVSPNGWSSIAYHSQAECEERRDALNENMSKTEYANFIKGVCQINDPTLPSFKL